MAGRETRGLWPRTDEPLLWLGGAGHEVRRDASYFHDASRRPDRPHYVLQLTLGGEGFYERKGQRRLLPAGMAFLDMIPGEFTYGYPPEARAPYEQVYVGLTGRTAEMMCRRIVSEFGNVLNFGRDPAISSMMLSVAHQHNAGTLRDRYLVSGRLYQLLMAALSALKTSQLATSDVVSEAMGLVEREARDSRLNVVRLARMLSCSREHLTRQFRQSTGVSPGDYINQHRLGAVARMLRSSDHKLDVIAGECGFSSANYLCRAFRKRYGVTPAQFRRTPWVVTE